MVSLGPTNSYDTWHGNNSFAKENVYNVLYTPTGTKNVAKQMAKISQGRVRDKRVTWFPELADKNRFMCKDVLISNEGSGRENLPLCEHTVGIISPKEHH